VISQNCLHGGNSNFGIFQKVRGNPKLPPTANQISGALFSLSPRITLFCAVVLAYLVLMPHQGESLKQQR